MLKLPGITSLCYSSPSVVIVSLYLPPLSSVPCKWNCFFFPYVWLVLKWSDVLTVFLDFLRGQKMKSICQIWGWGELNVAKFIFDFDSTRSSKVWSRWRALKNEIVIRTIWTSNSTEVFKAADFMFSVVLALLSTLGQVWGWGHSRKWVSFNPPKN